MVNKREIELQEIRKHFPLFAKAVMPILDLTPFHLIYYKILHKFALGHIKRLIVTVPPQHGKSQGSSILLPAFLLGMYPNLRIVLASYSATLATKFNKRIQRILDNHLYREIFPQSIIKGDGIKSNGHIRTSDYFEIINNTGSVMSVGREGSLTGNHVDVIIMDDIYKDAMEANSPTIRENTWEWYTSVARTRLHNNSQELIVFTRWHEEDLIGRLEQTEEVKLIESFSDIDKDFRGYHKINFEAIKESKHTLIDPRNINEPLWPERHSYEKLIESRNLDGHSFSCLYQGNPVAKEGLLYSTGFKTYSELPDIIKISNFTDTADTGNDKLCSICYAVGKDKKIYILDVLYTTEPMEATEELTAKMLTDNNVRVAYIESNNGGRGFARNIQR